MHNQHSKGNTQNFISLAIVVHQLFLLSKEVKQTHYNPHKSDIKISYIKKNCHHTKFLNPTLNSH